MTTKPADQLTLAEAQLEAALLLPRLRKPYEVINHTFSGLTIYHTSCEKVCQFIEITKVTSLANDCQGRGWVPETTTDALLEAGKPFGISLEWFVLEERWLAETFVGVYVRGYGAAPAEALVRALVAAVRQEAQV